MATVSNGQREPVKLPELPSAQGHAQSAQRARSLPATAVDVTHGDRKRLPKWTVPAISAALTGGSLLTAQPPSLAQTWARHRDSARHFRAWWLRFPRYAWGAAHTGLKACLLAVEWVTDSPPKLAVAVAVAVACWFFS